MKGLIGSSSAHYIEGFHPRANLSPCKQSEFDVRPHFIRCLDQKVITAYLRLGCKGPALARYESEDVARFRIAL